VSADKGQLRLLPPALVPLPEAEEAELVEALARLLLRHRDRVEAAGSSAPDELDVSRPSSA
jgi:hypothetical protein